MKHGYKRAIAMLLAATVMTGLTACGRRFFLRRRLGFRFRRLG